MVASISGVEWAFGVGPASDARNTGIPGGATEPARAFYGQLPPVIHRSDRARLVDGLALTGPGLATTLGLADGVGSVSNRGGQAVVVGSFVASAPLTALNANSLTMRAAASDRLLTLWVSVADVSQLGRVTAAVRDALITTKSGAVRVAISAELTRLGSDVTATLAQTARLTVSGLLLAVALLLAAVQYGRVSGMAKDIGRSRALGATRSTIVLQVLTNAALCGVAGAFAGVVVGLVITAIVAGTLPGWGFTAGVALLIVLASLVGAIAPAIRAARLDPVRILRVP